ncbi:MAG: PEP/pyruvate-binding domain-containing protein, partial [Candidatus Thiodiazotropha sp. 6PLUC5]
MIINSWEAILQAGAEQVGGKAWQLARLYRYGFKIPPGQVVSVEAYRRWLDNSKLELELLKAARSPQDVRAEALAEVTDRLIHLPTGVELKSLANSPMAVRSSAPQEDSTRASFAGIHASCLNVQGNSAMEQAIRTVWLSLWTTTAIAYRERIGLAHEQASMAVLIMPLIPAKVSGIGFTKDPRSGRDDRMVIHATQGLGESLVSGRTTGDEIVLAEDLQDDSLKLLSLTPGDKSLRIDAKPGGGTEALQLPSDNTPALNETELLQLGEQLRLAASALDYTKPDFDLEWAWDGKQFWLLQARPITATNRCTYPELATQPEIWSRGNTKDVVPYPLSPFDWSASRRLVNAILKEGFKLAGLKLQPGVQRAGLFKGRLYINLSLLQWEGYASVGVMPEAMNRLIGGHQPTIELSPSKRQRLAQGINLIRYLINSPARLKAGRAAINQVMEKVEQWKNDPLPETEEDFANTLRKYCRYSRDAHDLHFLQGSASSALSFLVDTIDERLPGEGHALAAALMAGGSPSVTAQMGYDLVTLAKQAVADPFTQEWLQQRKRGEALDWRQLPKSNPLRQGFTTFLKRHGHRGLYETYTRNPRWHEQPDYLLDNLLQLAETDLEAQSLIQQEARNKALERVKHALPWWKRPMLNSMVGAAKRGSNDREAARSAMIAMMDPLRQMLLHLGERWVEAGWLEKRDEILYLMQHEIFAVLENALAGEAVKPRIVDRRRQFETWQQKEAADVIMQQPDGKNIEQIEKRGATLAGGDCYKGIPVGTGRTRGIARILHNPEQGERLGHNEILVTPSTDPAWTPLFLKAGGLVMETGGYLSHGAIVAREFGIPAVVNLPGILQQLSDGELIEVDGVEGVVTKLEV